MVLTAIELTTFTAALLHDGIAAPMVLNGPMSGEAFFAMLSKRSSPICRPGDVVIICRPTKVRQSH